MPMLTQHLWKLQTKSSQRGYSRFKMPLDGLVDELNDMETEMIGMKPKDAIVLDQVPLVTQENYPEEDTLPEDGLYQYLLQPSREEHDDQ